MVGSDLAAGFNVNIEQERRNAALVFRIAIEERSMHTVLLSPSQAILFLHLSGWDLCEAAARWNAVSVRKNYALLGQFDHMRAPVHRDIERDDVMALQAQDERLATFINITGRPDWYSLRERLIECDWDLIEAIQAWFRPGVRPTRPPRRAGVAGIRQGLNLQPLGLPQDGEWEAAEDTVLDESWGPEPDYFTPSNSPRLPTEGQPTEDGKEGHTEEKGEAPASKKKAPTKAKKGTVKVEGRARRNGFLIHIDETNARNTAQLGVPNTSLLLIEWISKGRYWVNRFKTKKLRWP